MLGKFQRHLLRALKLAAEPSKAAAMQSYMKSSMPYLGVSSAPMRAVCKDVFAAHRFETFDTWRDACLTVWREAKYREQRYAALELTGHRFYRDFQTLETLPLYEEMIMTGAWWDFVDAIASRRLGPLLHAYPKQMRKTMRQWSRSPNMWKRRSAILCQLSFRNTTDLELLYACIESSLGSKEFFLQKAIGWALRQVVWKNPDEILRYVNEYGSRLSPLSKREALKNIGKK